MTKRELKTCPGCGAEHNYSDYSGDYCLNCGRDRDRFVRAAITGLCSHSVNCKTIEEAVEKIISTAFMIAEEAMKRRRSGKGGYV